MAKMSKSQSLQPLGNPVMESALNWFLQEEIKRSKIFCNDSIHQNISLCKNKISLLSNCNLKPCMQSSHISAAQPDLRQQICQKPQMVPCRDKVPWIRGQPLPKTATVGEAFNTLWDTSPSRAVLICSWPHKPWTWKICQTRSVRERERL